MSFERELFCVGCGYDLSHTDREHACPECGMAVHKTLEDRSNRAKRNVNANAALTLGVLSVIIFPPLGILAIYYFNLANIDRKRGHCPAKAYRAATVGLIFGIGGLLLGFLFLAMMFGP